MGGAALSHRSHEPACAFVGPQDFRVDNVSLSSFTTNGKTAMEYLYRAAVDFSF